jgi:outer membrane protein
MTLRIAFAALAGFSLFGVTAFADEKTPRGPGQGFSGTVAAGAMMVPDYEGSSDYTAAPLVFFNFRYDQYYIQSEGLGVKANVSPFRAVEAGPVVSLRGGRDSDVESDAVGNLREVDDAVEAGLFLTVPFNDVAMERDQFSLNVKAMTDISDTHEGSTISFGPGYAFFPTDQLRLSASLSATYADDDYMRTYFGIDRATVGTSGLALHTAEAGLKDVGVTLTANYALTKNWGLVGIAGYTRLLGDAADSPIVDVEGDAGQGRLGLGVSYRF